jgi:hypothetical protein
MHAVTMYTHNFLMYVYTICTESRLTCTNKFPPTFFLHYVSRRKILNCFFFSLLVETDENIICLIKANIPVWDECEWNTPRIGGLDRKWKAM